VQRFTVAFNFFVSCWAYEGRHLSLSVQRKITVNVFYSTFTNVFFILGECFFIYDSDSFMLLVVSTERSATEVREAAPLGCGMQAA